MTDKPEAEIDVTLSYDLCELMKHFEQDHFARDARSSKEKRAVRARAERYLKALAAGQRDAETLIFAQELAVAILRVGNVLTTSKKRPDAMLRAVGMAGHKPTEHDELAYDVQIASAFGIPEDQVIREHQEAGKIDRFKGDAEVDPQSIKRAIRRASGGK